MNERGVIVIPEEMREDLGLEGKVNLVLIESNHEIILKKESDVAQLLSQTNEDKVWKELARRSLERAWDKEDEAWEKFAPKKK